MTAIAPTVMSTDGGTVTMTGTDRQATTTRAGSELCLGGIGEHVATTEAARGRRPGARRRGLPDGRLTDPAMADA